MQDPRPTLLERAAEYEIAAKVAFNRGDTVNAEDFARHAHRLRMEDARGLEEGKDGVIYPS